MGDRRDGADRTAVGAPESVTSVLAPSKATALVGLLTSAKMLWMYCDLTRGFSRQALRIRSRTRSWNWSDWLPTEVMIEFMAWRR